MKNPFKLLYQWILRLMRRKQFKKRQEIYDDVIEKLADVVAKKREAQVELEHEIKDYMRKKLGYDSKSEYIPYTTLNDAELKAKIHAKFKFRMDKVDMYITDDLILKCI
jgi:hypothetical protein